VYASNSKGRSKVEMIRSQTSPFQVAITKLFPKSYLSNIISYNMFLPSPLDI
jgi:hypothetical protein